MPFLVSLSGKLFDREVDPVVLVCCGRCLLAWFELVCFIREMGPYESSHTASYNAVLQ